MIAHVVGNISDTGILATMTLTLYYHRNNRVLAVTSRDSRKYKVLILSLLITIASTEGKVYVSSKTY